MRLMFDVRCVLSVIFLSGLSAPSSVHAQDPFALDGFEPATVAAAPEPELTSEQRLATNEEKLNRPVKVELKEGQTVHEALKQIAKAVELKVELEGMHPLVSSDIYGETLVGDLGLDCKDFKSALRELGANVIMNPQSDAASEELYRGLMHQYIAAPTPEGVLISNPLVRMRVPCRMETKVYDVSDFLTFEQPQQTPAPPRDLVSLIEQHVTAYWSTSGLGEEGPTPVNDAWSADGRPIDSSAAFMACRMNYLSAKQLLAIKAPRSVHYEVSRLLESLREKVREREEPPAAAKPSTATYHSE